MREILFKGKAKNDTYTKDGQWIYSSFMMQDPKKELLSHAVELFNNNKWVAIDPDTVGQYTGLTDKNGNKIFEGDIVKVEYIGFSKGIETQIAEVVFEKCKFALVWGWHKEIVCLTDFANVCFEVIGNIHDNPELLTLDK